MEGGREIGRAKREGGYHERAREREPFHFFFFFFKNDGKDRRGPGPPRERVGKKRDSKRATDREIHRENEPSSPPPLPNKQLQQKKNKKKLVQRGVARIMVDIL